MHRDRSFCVELFTRFVCFSSVLRHLNVFPFPADISNTHMPFVHSTLYIDHFCTICAVVYAVNVLLLFILESSVTSITAEGKNKSVFKHRLNVILCQR